MQSSREELLRKALSDLKVPQVPSHQESWEATQEKIRNGKIVQMRSATPIPWWAWTSAAAACALFGFFLSRNTEEITIVQSHNAILEHVLPDSSRVLLNAGSSVQYNEADFAEKREIKFEGEAFVEVRPGAAFNLVSASGSVRVLGTSFNVYSRSEKLRVRCFTGEVEVISSGESVRIRSGECAERLKIGLKCDKFDPERPDWKKGEIHFDDAPLEEVLAELERQFGIEISGMNNISQKHFSGMFRLDDMEEVLELVEVSMNVRIVPCGVRAYCVEERGSYENNGL